ERGGDEDDHAQAEQPGAPPARHLLDDIALEGGGRLSLWFIRCHAISPSKTPWAVLPSWLLRSIAKRYGTASNVVGVANRRPPMTARASAAFCSSPAPPIAMGIMPTIIAAAVISTGRIRVRPASIAACRAVRPASCCSRAKVTSRMEFAEATPTAMIAPISDGTLSVVPL